VRQVCYLPELYEDIKFEKYKKKKKIISQLRDLLVPEESGRERLQNAGKLYRVGQK